MLERIKTEEDYYKDFISSQPLTPQKKPKGEEDYYKEFMVNTQYEPLRVEQPNVFERLKQGYSEARQNLGSPWPWGEERVKKLVQIHGMPPDLYLSKTLKTKFWKNLITNLHKQAKTFAVDLAQKLAWPIPPQGISPQEWMKPYKSVIKEPKSFKKTIQEKNEVIKGLIEYIPKTAIEFFADPIGTLEEKPLDSLFLFSVISPKVRAKFKTGKVVSPKDIKETINKIPDEVMSQETKVTITDKVVQNTITKVSKQTKEFLKENTYLRAPIEKVLKDAENGVRLARLALDERLNEASNYIKNKHKTSTQEVPGERILRLRKRLKERGFLEKQEAGEIATVEDALRKRNIEQKPSETLRAKPSEEIKPGEAWQKKKIKIGGQEIEAGKLFGRTDHGKIVSIKPAKSASGSTLKGWYDVTYEDGFVATTKNPPKLPPQKTPEELPSLEEQIAEFYKKNKVEKLPPGVAEGALESKLTEGLSEIPLPEKTGELYAGYPFLKELKKSLEYLKAGKIEPSLITKTPQKTEKITTKPPVGEPSVPSLELEPAQKVIQALRESKPLRQRQEKLYTKERSTRLAKALKAGEKIRGEKGFYAEKARLVGELPKIEFESIRQKLTQQDIDSLFNQVKDSPALTEWEKLPAREGLAKLFRKEGGKIPTRNEMELLNRVFGKEFTKTILMKRSTWQKIKEGLYEVANIPRSVMASYDLSAPFRQGIFLLGRPKRFFGSFFKMFKYFPSEKAYKGLVEEITKRPTYNLMRRSKLALTEIDSSLTLREERFMSHIAEKIPGVRASGRAYMGFLNKLRADVFDDLVKKAEKLGLEPKKNPELTRAIASFVNNATGRGSLGKLEGSAVALNSFFFSPRLMASRFNLLNPIYYVKSPPFVRTEALKSLFALAGIGSTVLGIAKLAGAKVGVNPLSADFGKIKIGNTRIDIWGGFQPYIRSAVQFILSKAKSTTTGKTSSIDRLTVLSRWFEYKEAPVVSFATGLLRGKTVFGKEFNIPKEIGNRFVPMVIQDVVDIAKDNPDLLPVSILGIFGIGLQTYKPKRKLGVY